MKYRKKPVVIEAVQYNGELIMFNVPKWLERAQSEGIIYFEDASPARCFIRTPECDMKVSIGNYILRDENGELRTCKPDIFKQTYERVE